MNNLAIPVAFALGISYLAIPGSVSAQEVPSSCNPATGLTPAGTECVTLTPVDPTRYQTQIDAAGVSNYRPVDVGQLADTYECSRSDSDGAYGIGGDILVEDCGEPIAIDPATLREFVGYAGNTPPAPTYVAPVAPPAAPVYVAPPAPVAVAVAPVVPAPPVYASIPFSSAGLRGAGLAFAGLGAATVVGIAALVASSDDDDDNSTVSTVSTN